MNFLLTIRIALRALGKNKLRAGLTVLGVVIGIAAVTTMVSVGQSAGALVQGQLQSLGTNVIIVSPGSTRSGGVRDATVPTLTAADDDQDDIVLMPCTTVKKRIQGSNFDNVNAIIVSARSLTGMEDATNQMRQLLLERHHIHPGEQPDFRVQNTTEIANTLGVITG